MFVHTEVDTINKTAHNMLFYFLLVIGLHIWGCGHIYKVPDSRWSSTGGWKAKQGRPDLDG